MKLKSILLAASLFFYMFSFSQSSKDLRKNLIIFATDKFDPNASITFASKKANKHGWDKANKIFTEAFALKGFQVVSNVNSPHKYIFLLDYDYGYLIAAYKMQYSNLKGEIVDVTNNSEIIGTFSYSGRYENDDIASALALNLKSKPVLVQKTVPQNTQTVKSKEDRLRELKDLFDKQLINKEVYDKAKQKILDEQ